MIPFWVVDYEAGKASLVLRLLGSSFYTMFLANQHYLRILQKPHALSFLLRIVVGVVSVCLTFLWLLILWRERCHYCRTQQGPKIQVSQWMNDRFESLENRWLYYQLHAPQTLEDEANASTRFVLASLVIGFCFVDLILAFLAFG